MKKGTIKDFWKKLFQGYGSPQCPNCGTDMRMKRIHIERQLTGWSIFGTHSPIKAPTIPSSPEEIEAEFECWKCGTKLKGWGRGLKIDFDNKSFSLEEFGVTEWEGKAN